MHQKIFSFLFFVTIALMAGVGECNKQGKAGGCIDQEKISEGPCTLQYDPVCGCDGKTYSNECAAQRAGVTKWEKGACK